MILEVPLGSIWQPLGKLKRQIKAPFSPEAPRRVPGRDLASIFWWIWDLCCRVFDFVFDVFGVEL